MNCIKCGKEIPEGENKICEECKKKLLSEVSDDSSIEDIKKDNKKSKKSNKEKNEESENKKINKKFIIITTIVLLIFLIVTLVYIYIFPFGKKGVGNTIGNIRNYGYATIDGDTIYYLSPNEDSSKIGINKVDKNGENKTQLFMDNLDILSLNVFDNYLYFIGISSEIYNEEDSINNKIYRMKTDGTDLQIINDNEFNDNCYEIYVVNNNVYYIGKDANIYKMNLDGTNKQLVSENGTGYLGITDKYIIYNTYPEGETEETATDYVTCIMNLDGSNSRKIGDGKRLYSANIKDDYIYYTNEEKQIYKVKIDGSEDTLVYDTTAYNMNLSGDYIYYLNYKDFENEKYTVCVYKLKIDGSENPIEVKELETYSSFIDVVGDWVLYMDSNEGAGYIKLVKTDGSEEKNLYELNYDKLIKSNTNSEESNLSDSANQTNNVEEQNIVIKNEV